MRGLPACGVACGCGDVRCEVREEGVSDPRAHMTGKPPAVVVLHSLISRFSGNCLIVRGNASTVTENVEK